MSKKFILNPGQLTLDILKKVWQQKQQCVLSDDAIKAINTSHQQLQAILRQEKTVYGINTGFGSLAHCRIAAQDLQQLQRNIVLSHACGSGELLDDDLVALILLLKINALAQGYSGVRLEVIKALMTLYNQQVYPCIPAKGSVGASGDLVPLAHMSVPLLGVGEMRYQGQILPAAKGLAIAGLEPLVLEAKEGLALLNGLQVSTALAISALFTAETLCSTALVAGSLALDAAKGSDVPFDERIHQARGQAGQSDVAAIYRKLLAGSTIRESHRDCLQVQDPYSLRCQPQIMGAVVHQLRFVRMTLEAEANAVTDNPLIFAEDAVLSGGNFHGEIIAMAADNMALAIAEIGASSERRIALLIDKHFSGLPAFLIEQGGLNSGFMIAHVTAAACASENKALAYPHCVDSIPTSANQEDHVSMATGAARRLHVMLDNTATILAIELLAACQGLEFHRPLQTSSLLHRYYEQVRKEVPPYDHDRYFAPDLKRIKELVLAEHFVDENARL